MTASSLQGHGLSLCQCLLESSAYGVDKEVMSLCIYHLAGVHPYWVGDLDTIILRNPDLYGNNGLYGNKKSLSQQLVIE